jgi:hypothetical protein
MKSMSISMSSSRVFENLRYPSESGRHTMSKCTVDRNSMVRDRHVTKMLLQSANE